MRRSASKDLLDPGRTLEQLGVAEGETLVLLERTELKTDAQMMIEAGERVPISEENDVYLQSEREGHIYDITWQPAVIGRADRNDPSKNRLLALDLSGLRGGEYVSRLHACIIERGDQYLVESLNLRNPTYLNDEELEYATSYVLQPGDRLRVGRITLIFHQRG
jgi:pSer/pThr/pTyr-binding forkhead associated (FHA) protein